MKRGVIILRRHFPIPWNVDNHDKDKNRFVKAGAPCEVIHAEKFDRKADAYARERKIKSYKSGNEFKRLVGIF